jgi:hypothetical protein
VELAFFSQKRTGFASNTINQAYSHFHYIGVIALLYLRTVDVTPCTTMEMALPDDLSYIICQLLTAQITPKIYTSIVMNNSSCLSSGLLCT